MADDAQQQDAGAPVDLATRLAWAKGTAAPPEDMLDHYERGPHARRAEDERLRMLVALGQAQLVISGIIRAVKTLPEYDGLPAVVDGVTAHLGPCLCEAGTRLQLFVAKRDAAGEA